MFDPESEVLREQLRVLADEIDERDSQLEALRHLTGDALELASDAGSQDDHGLEMQVCKL